MAQFDREAFRKRIAERAKLAAEKKLEERVENLSEEEKQVLKAYKEWKGKKEGKKVDVDASDIKTKIREKIKEKKEKRARVERIQKKLAEKRLAKENGNVSDKIKLIKEKIANIKARLAEEELVEPALAAGSPVMDAVPPAESAIAAPAAQLPPDVVAEIQNIVSAVDSLAVLAGIEKAPAVEPGPDVNAAIPGQVAAPGAAPEAPMLEKTKTMKEEEEVSAETEAGTEMNESLDKVRERIRRRREALKAIRAKALEEGYDGVTSGKENLSDMTPVITVPEARLGYNANPKKGDDASMKGTATLKAGKTWPTKTVPAKKSFEVQEAEEVAEEGEKMEESADWATRHIDHFLEKKELDFKALLKSGQLG